MVKSFSNHPLTGIYKGYKDAHVEDNIVLIYRYDDKGLSLVDLILQDLGDHKELFSKSGKRNSNIKKTLM